MTRINYHGLKFQILLVVKLFVICIAVAIYFVANRTWVEGFFKESYSAPPESLQDAIDGIRMGASIQKEYKEIPLKDREFLYDFWISTEPLELNAPRILLKTDYKLFSKRVERTLISGSNEQRLKALKFFELANHPKTISILKKAKAWSQRRKMSDLETSISETIQKLNIKNILNATTHPANDE